MSEIRKFYAGKNVLITGATGFIGKVVVERLLRDCDEVNCIYLIVRRKKDFDTRCKDLLNHIVFDDIRARRPQQLNKIKFFQGDLSVENLGLSPSNLTEILDNTDIVIHSGADVRFDLVLRDILTTNTLGTYRLLELAKRIKNLKIFVFVSTAYSQSHKMVTEERHYNAVVDPFIVLKAIERCDEKILITIQSKILKEFPNTYSFSKHLSEDIVHQYSNKIPICVVRPSVVCAAIEYPLPAYTEGLHGLNGLYFALMKGISRTSHINPAGYIHTIPVDIVANAIIATSWIHGSKKLNHIEYYTTNMREEHLLPAVEVNEIGKEVHYTYPLNNTLWSPNSRVTNCVFRYNIRIFIYQILPAIILDLLLLVFGRKPILLKVQRKIFYGLTLMKPYMKRLQFKTENFKNIRQHLNKQDNELFSTDIDHLTEKIYMELKLHGIRKFVAKEKEEDLPRARKNNLMLRRMHIVVQFLIAAYLVKMVYDCRKF